MFPQIVGNTSGTLFGVAKEESKERLARDSRDKGGLEVHVLLCFFPHQDVNLFHVYSQRTNACVLFTPILRLVVKASQTRRKVRERVFPAPKTPATANVDRPV